MVGSFVLNKHTGSINSRAIFFCTLLPGLLAVIVTVFLSHCVCILLFF